MRLGDKYIDEYGIVWTIYRFNFTSKKIAYPVLWSKECGEGNWYNGLGLKRL